MSNELAVRPQPGVQISTIDDVARVSRMFAESGFFSDAREAAQCGVKIMAGAAWGIDAFSSMVGIHIINNKPSVSAGLMAAAVKGHPKYDYRLRENTDKVCRIEFFERAESLGVSEYTIEMAQRAGLTNNPTWKKFPEAMLFARAMSAGVRKFCPDVFHASVYTPEELGADVDEEGTPVRVEVVSRPEKPQERPRAAEPTPVPEPDTEPPRDANGDFQRVMATDDQLKAVARELKKQGVNKDDALGYFRWLLGRNEIESARDLEAREATTFLALVAHDGFENSLADYAAEIAMREEDAA
jgi:hypothetical protein